MRQTDSGEQLSAVRIVNDPVALGLQLEAAGSNPEVVLEATYGWSGRRRTQEANADGRKATGNREPVYRPLRRMVAA